MKKKAAVCGILCSLMFSAAGTYAYYMDRTEVKNQIVTGDIHIGITEYETDGKKEKIYEGPEDGMVLPSQKISKIPRITNYGQTCYIRIKPVFEGEEKGQNLYCLQEKDLEGISENWIGKEEYYYYKYPVQQGESIDFFRQVSIPEEWTEEAQDTNLGITLEAEAVQSANFIPDFAAEKPWGELTAEQCIHEKDNQISEVAKDHLFLSVIYEGPARKMVAAPKDFFEDQQPVMPGDRIENSFILKNTSAKEAEFFFQSAVPEDLGQEDEELLEQCTLRIWQNDRIIYQGNLRSRELESRISLGILASGDHDDVSFSIDIPASWNNAFALRNSAVRWIFSVEGEELDEDPKGPALSYPAPKTGLARPDFAIPFTILLAAVVAGRREKRRERRTV